MPERADRPSEMPHREVPEGERPLAAEEILAESELTGEPASNGRGSAAAFFDLDKTLMAGSSGIFFARAAYETGMITRARLARDVYENLRFRLRGSTDDRADDVRRRVGAMIAGVRVRDLERLSPRVLAGVLPRLYPQMLARAYAHQDAGGPVYILTAASRARSTTGRARCSRCARWQSATEST